MKSGKMPTQLHKRHKLKPTVMLIPDYLPWILGRWAKEIVRLNSDKYNFIIFPKLEINDNMDLFLSFLKRTDIIHCLYPHSYDIVSNLIKKNNITDRLLISSIHHVIEFSRVEPSTHADRVMVVCKKYLHELIARGVSKEKLFLIYSGVDTDFFTTKDTITSRRKLNIPENVFTIGFAGKAESNEAGRKGMDIFLNVFSRLPPELKSKTFLILCGIGWDDTLKNTSIDRERVKYFPFLEEDLMPDFYNSLSVYLVTSRIEGGPVPLIEAMSCGVPVITTRVGMVDDFIKDGINGLVIPMDNVERTIYAIQELFYDKKLSYRLSESGRKTILRHLRWEKTLRNIPQLYDLSQYKRIIDRERNSRITNKSIEKINDFLKRKHLQRCQELLKNYISTKNIS